jgi:hypothetical protein
MWSGDDGISEARSDGRAAQSMIESFIAGGVLQDAPINDKAPFVGPQHRVQDNLPIDLM